MTPEEFKEIFSKRMKYEKYWNYSLSMLFIFGGLVFSYFITTAETWGNSESWFKIFFIAIFIFFIGVGIYGLWTIPSIYRLTIICTDKERNENINIIKTIQKKLNLEEREVKNNEFYVFDYKGSFWNKLPVYLFAGKDEIYLNVQSRDYGIYRSGFIDFGAANRVTKILKKKLEDCC